MQTEKSPNLAEVAISYRSKVKASDRPVIRTAKDAYDLLKGIYSADAVEHHEEFVVLLLNRAMRVLGWAKISVGGITGTVADTRIIFQYALLANATGIVVSHNHPSGLTQPSDQDRTLTKKLVKAGEIMEIELKDHIIFAPDSYYSFAEESEI